MATRFVLKSNKLPSDDLAFANKVFVSPEDASKLLKGNSDTPPLVDIKGFVFSFEPHSGVKPGEIGVSSIQRRFAQVALNEPLDISLYVAKLETIYLSSLTLEVDYLQKGKKGDEEYIAGELSKIILQTLANSFFTVGQKFLIVANSNNLELTVKALETVNLKALVDGDTKATATKADKGILHSNTEIKYERAQGSAIKLAGGEDGSAGTPLFKPDFDFTKIGIGGLDNEFAQIFRRAFASRIYPTSVIKKLGIQHVKGILLYGPPSTGKTLMAKQISLMVTGKEPKVISGSTIFVRYVGEAEQNIRTAFRDAEEDALRHGDESDLHVFILDEMDVFCELRKEDKTPFGDTLFNQLLSKLEGPDSLNNILVIGMTNTKDMIDEILLRRLQIHLEISLPDENGRIQILNIHTRQMRENKILADDVDIKYLAKNTKNFSGGDIESLVKTASSWALQRQLDVTDGIKIKGTDIHVGKEDFEMALKEVKPAFAVDANEFENCMRNGIINYGPNINKLLTTGDTFVEQVRNSDRTPLVSVLLEGPAGAGKTALAVRLAKNSKYPFIKMISPETLVGWSETAKCSKITKVFDDAYKSPLSCIVVDDIERLLDYVRIGPRFSNTILQTLLVLLKKEPPKGRKLLILATTSNKAILQDMEFMEAFNAVLSVPQITKKEEFKIVLQELSIFGPSELEEAANGFNGSISIKKLIMIAEMAKQGTREGLLKRFYGFLADSALTSMGM